MVAVAEQLLELPPSLVSYLRSDGSALLGLVMNDDMDKDDDMEAPMPVTDDPMDMEPSPGR